MRERQRVEGVGAVGGAAGQDRLPLPNLEIRESLRCRNLGKPFVRFGIHGIRLDGRLERASRFAGLPGFGIHGGQSEPVIVRRRESSNMVVECNARPIGFVRFGVQPGKIAIGPVRSTVFRSELNGAFEPFGGFRVTPRFVKRDPRSNLKGEIRRRGIGAGDDRFDPLVRGDCRMARGSLHLGSGLRQPPRGFPETRLHHRVHGVIQRRRGDPEGLLDHRLGVLALAVALQHPEDRVKSVFPLDVFENERGVEVGNTHLGGIRRPHEPVVQVGNVEEQSVPQGEIEGKRRPVTETPALFEQTQPLREPARNTVLGQAHGHRVPQLVPERRGPMVGPDLPRRGGLQRNHVPEADAVGADPGDTHGPHRKIGRAVVDLDAEGFGWLVPVALPERLHRLPRQSLDIGAEHSRLARREHELERRRTHLLEAIQLIEQVESVLDQSVEWIPLESIFQHGPAFVHFAEPKQVETQ